MILIISQTSRRKSIKDSKRLNKRKLNYNRNVCLALFFMHVLALRQVRDKKGVSFCSQEEYVPYSDDDNVF